MPNGSCVDCAQSWDDPHQYENTTCGVRLDPEQQRHHQQQRPAEDAPNQAPPLKRQRTGDPQGEGLDTVAQAERTAEAARGTESQSRIGERVASGAAASTSGRRQGTAPQTNPIDHIFQFHKVRPVQDAAPLSGACAAGPPAGRGLASVSCALSERLPSQHSCACWMVSLWLSIIAAANTGFSTAKNPEQLAQAWGQGEQA